VVHHAHHLLERVAGSIPALVFGLARIQLDWRFMDIDNDSEDFTTYYKELEELAQIKLIKRKALDYNVRTKKQQVEYQTLLRKHSARAAALKTYKAAYKSFYDNGVTSLKNVRTLKYLLYTSDQYILSLKSLGFRSNGLTPMVAFLISLGSAKFLDFLHIQMNTPWGIVGLGLIVLLGYLLGYLLELLWLRWVLSSFKAGPSAKRDKLLILRQIKLLDERMAHDQEEIAAARADIN
jgi:hypothetical protein